jgi:DNA mismatch repair protein MutL
VKPKPIIQLDAFLINKIAAGEVVERPLSVVKELTENAIDAGASIITVEIRDGGLTYIRVTDNGSGIPFDQLPLAFARHATSKITVQDDLYDVRTLGFRGEALCSIAAVAQVEMITKTPDAVTGTRVEVHGGSEVSNQPVGCTNGTTLVVSNLFYNTPARRKFLKKPATEAGYVADCVQRLAISHPGLSFRYINNGQLVFQTNGNGDLKTVLLQIYGRETVSKLVAVQGAANGVSLDGYIGKPETARGNRQYGNFYINNRYIQSKLLQQAVESSVRVLLPAGKFPVYALRLDVPPEEVDVNVHPTKMDVRFADEEGIFLFVLKTVRDSLGGHNLIPEVRFERKAAKETEPAYDKIDLTAAPLPVLPSKNISTPVYKNEPSATYPSTPVMRKASTEPTDDGMVMREEISPAKAPFINIRNYHIHGLLFGTYWLVAQGESLFLIDQHAAHERVLYEEIIQKAAQSAIHSQPLLEPLVLRLTPGEKRLLRDHAGLFERFGFVLTETEPYTLTALPYIVKGSPSTVLLTDLLDTLEGAGASSALKESAVAMAACKAAVKANDALTEPEARALIQQMLHLQNPFTCPHGRPTAIEITKREIERKFKRV